MKHAGMRSCTALAVAAVLALTGCERVMRDMYEQPRKGPGDASPLFADGKASRPPPPGSIARAIGDLAATSSGRRGDDVPAAMDASLRADTLPPVTPALLQRGKERYEIYCSPCHGLVGDGNGQVALRGFPHPPSYHEARLREAPDRHFFDVITTGHGVMHSYAGRVALPDRWAITAYIRALQLSQHVGVDELPATLRERLLALPATPAASTARTKGGS